MGWTGHYTHICLKGQERVNFVIEREGLNCEDEIRKWEVLKASYRGARIWFAIRYTYKPTGKTYVLASLALTYHEKNGYLYVKIMDETCGPYFYDCPKSILNLLTEPRNEYSREWRKACAQQGQKRSKLADLPFGTVFELHNTNRDHVYVHKTWNGRRWYVNCNELVRYSARYINQIGYHVVDSSVREKY